VVVVLVIELVDCVVEVFIFYSGWVVVNVGVVGFVGLVDDYFYVFYWIGGCDVEV